MKPSTHKKKHRSKPRRDGEWDSASRRLISQIELLQMREAAAEDTWKQAKEQFSQAKRRRKVAKLLARRAKKYAKMAKAKLFLARKALARAKEKSATIDWLATPRKLSKSKQARPLSRKHSRPKRSTWKSALAGNQAASRQPAVPSAAESNPGVFQTSGKVAKAPPSPESKETDS